MWCSYCKEKIKNNEAHTVGQNGDKYHIECYKQMTTYVDEFGETTTDEFGESSAEEYGY